MYTTQSNPTLLSLFYLWCSDPTAELKLTDPIFQERFSDMSYYWRTAGVGIRERAAHVLRDLQTSLDLPETAPVTERQRKALATVLGRIVDAHILGRFLDILKTIHMLVFMSLALCEADDHFAQSSPH